MNTREMIENALAKNPDLLSLIDCANPEAVYIASELTSITHEGWFDMVRLTCVVHLRMSDFPTVAKASAKRFGVFIQANLHRLTGKEIDEAMRELVLLARDEAERLLGVKK